MIKYREDQIPIMNYEEGKMAVQAVPGAGKTFIITNLVSKLIEEKRNQNSKILILTYMNSAVNNFKTRIKKILSDKNISSRNTYEVMTIHSLAVKIIKEKPEVLMLSDEFLILDEFQQNIILSECIKKYKETESGNRVFNYFLKEIKKEEMQIIAKIQWEDYFFKLVANCISKLKYKNISSNDLENLIGTNYNGLLRVILPIYKEYEEKLKKEGFLDFDDILIYAHKALLLDENLRNIFKTKYKYIFEDECQDSNEIQGEIIKLICSGNLVRVGDVNQSITGTFSNSDPKFFKNFTKEAEFFYKMDMSNRSSKDVLHLANHLSNELSKIYKDALDEIEIKTVPKGEGYKENPEPKNYQMYFKEYKMFDDEVLGVINYIKTLQKAYPEKSIGILTPYNKDIEIIAQKLDDENIEYEELGVNSLKKRKIIIDLSKIIDFLIDCDDLNKLIKVLDEVFLSDESFVNDKKILFKNLKKYDTEELFYNDEINFKNLEFENNNFYEKYILGVKILKEVLEYSFLNIENLILFIKEKLNLEKEDKAVIDYLAFYFKYLLIENASIKDLQSILSNSKNKTLTRIVESIYDTKEHEVLGGSVTLCNYHKSKGLEWDVVFLIGLTEYNFLDINTQKFASEKWFLKEKYKNPVAVFNYELDKLENQKLNSFENKSVFDYFKEEKLDVINEKIRLLYVGVTRAKEMLFLSYSLYSSEEDIERNRKNKKSKYLELLLVEIQKQYQLRKN